MSKKQLKRVPIGDTVFVQACARLWSAAWIKRQIKETSTAPSPLDISGIAYAMRYTFASDIGMAFELALKTLKQGLSCNKDGEPQVKKSHDLHVLWNDLKSDCVQLEIDQAVESTICKRYGADNAGKVICFSEYLERHETFFDVHIRYANPKKNPELSFHVFIASHIKPPVLCISEKNGKGTNYVDSIAVLLSYWEAIMWKAWRLRWPDRNCEIDEGLAVDREEAKKLMKKAMNQLL